MTALFWVFFVYIRKNNQKWIGPLIKEGFYYYYYENIFTMKDLSAVEKISSIL
jgi:hypothetical protein